MNIIKKIVFLFGVLLFLSSCGDRFNQEAVVDVDHMYASALHYFNNGNLYEAREEFENILDSFPYRDEAIEAQVFLIWISYLQNDYLTTEITIDSFLKYYVANKYTDWANYMRALVAYEQMGDADRDIYNTIEALNLFSNIYRQYEGTDYQQEATYKISAIRHNLAYRNMTIAYFYLEDKSYIAAISRYQDIIDNYSESIFVQEAMYRLVYLWLLLGVDEEAYRVASVLGYNYDDSEWYSESLRLLEEYSSAESVDLPRNTINN